GSKRDGISAAEHALAGRLLREGHPRNSRRIHSYGIPDQSAIIAVYRIGLTNQLVRRGEIVAPAAFFVDRFYVVWLTNNHMDAAGVGLCARCRISELVRAPLRQRVAAAACLVPSQPSAGPADLSCN